MASIQRVESPLTGSISYRAQVRVKGRPALSETFPNRKEAKDWAASVEAAIREGRHFPHMRAKRMTFAGLADRYRTSVLADVKALSKATREQHLKWFAEFFLGQTVAEITPDRVAEARDALAAETFSRGKVRTLKGKEVPPKAYKRSGATVNRYLATLSHMFTMGVREWRLIDRNPIRDITKKKEARGRVRFLSNDERESLLKACANCAWKPLHTLVLLAISTGARRGELINLTWSNLDLKTARATVYETKNGETRVLPLVGRALEALRELKLQGSAKSEFVFPAPSNFPEPYTNFDSVWYDTLRAAHIENFRFHDLRHTCASYLASQGASLLEIADVLGHKTMSMVKRYSHLAQSHKVTAIEKMATERGL